jgi:hypothetical protein
LFGGTEQPAPRPPAPLDPLLPTGAEIDARPRPAAPDGAEPPACSFRRPVCVHRAAGVPPSSALGALGALERAWDRLVGVMRLPAPLPDSAGHGELDWYLSPEPDPELDVVADAIDPLDDRAAAFCVSGRRGLALAERAASVCLGEAIALGLDAAEAPHLRRAFAARLWLDAGRPTARDVQALDDVQARPERAIATRERDESSDGAQLLFAHLDATLGRGDGWVLPAALFALSAGRTPPGAWQWKNEPDAFDVLRHSFENLPSRVARHMGDLAVARAFVGDRDDGAHLPELAWGGAFGRVRIDWSLPFSSLPRRVAGSRPIEPTGACYVWVDLDQAPGSASLGFRAEWEAPVAFKWLLVKVAPDGREIGRVDVTFEEQSTSAERELVGLEGAAGILIVGTNLGGVDLAHPFDPDHAPFEPSGFTVYVARL